MRPSDADFIEPEMLAELGAIDAVLRGEPVDPEHAEVAELAVLVAAERPAVDPDTAARLDERVGRRLAGGAPARAARPHRRRRRTWALSAVATAAVGVLVAVVVVGSSPRPVPRLSMTQAAPSTSAPGSGAARPSAAGASPAAPAAPAAPSARKVVQTAQLALTTGARQIESVAGQVFDVVHAEGGFVSQSNVTQTGGSDGNAQFQLSVPSASLSDAMARLSRLRGAQVASRTDTTQDVNDQFNALARRLADARALRTALLKQLAGASTPQQVSSLKAQIADADAAISRGQGAVNALNHQINFTQISVTVSADGAPGAGGGGFTIGRAAHDAGHVLAVMAAVALLALAVLAPLGLLGALLWWVRGTLRRRRREQALDLA